MAEDYKYIKLWHRQSGSQEYYVQDVVRQAQSVNAPQNAIYRRVDSTWVTTDEIESPETRTWLGLD